MAEPEDVVAEGALLATKLARDLWARHTRRSQDHPPRLHDVRMRVELFVAAVFAGAPEIGVANPPAPLSFLGRLSRRRSAQAPQRDALASTDGLRIRLPESLDTLSIPSIIDGYRVLALEQAARAVRGTPASAPPVGDPLLRDLYLLAEAAAVDCVLVRMLPRLCPSLQHARGDALRQRPLGSRMSGQEQAVEAIVRALLSADPTTPPAPFVDTGTPLASLAWAKQQRTHVTEFAGPYRMMAPVALWGTLDPGSERPTPSSADGNGLDLNSWPSRTRKLSRRPRIRDASENEEDEKPGTWIVRADDVQEKAEDPAGLNRPADRDQHADPGELADALSELPEARLVRGPGKIHEVLVGEDPIQRAPGALTPIGSTGIAYPEWDWRVGAYRPAAAIVRETFAEESDSAWADEVMVRHASIVRRLRRDFERLRPRRTTLRRQREGAELDVDAMVEAHADRLAGKPVDDRCYVDSRPGRRDVAIALLVDASGSTDGWVAGTRRIIDVEKEALLVVGEALAASADPHAIFVFCGEGPSRVEMRILKSFAERSGSGAVRQRIAALEPAGYTRAGAALRHATVNLMRQPARFRLLLVLSDGRPNDVDQYEGRYGIEDTRAAVMEARLQGVHCHCLTVDREAPRYATRIFGRDFAVLSRPERLPVVLTSVLRDLVRG